jgi:hypothetical protein
LPLYKSLLEVQLEQLDRDSSVRRQGPDEGASEREMIDPTLPPGVKETDEFAGFGIERS